MCVGRSTERTTVRMNILRIAHFLSSVGEISQITRDELAPKCTLIHVRCVCEMEIIFLTTLLWLFYKARNSVYHFSQFLHILHGILFPLPLVPYRPVPSYRDGKNQNHRTIIGHGNTTKHIATLTVPFARLSTGEHTFQGTFIVDIEVGSIY